MKNLYRIGVLTTAMLCAVSLTAADQYAFRVVVSGLARPTGITIEGSEVLYFTQVPTPGVSGANSVARFDLETGEMTILHMGEPEPRNIVQDREGTLYWTCTSAGVILRQTEDGTTTQLLVGLERPIGIAVDRSRNVFYTEVPMPGVAGGTNRVSVFDGQNRTVLHMGEPEPVDIAVARNDDLYWTCRTAGVILRRSGGVTSLFMSGLDHPVGIAIDHKSQQLYFTEVPTPGVSGSAGGRNKVWRVDLASGEKTLVHAGDPEPTDVTIARNGNVYWTCTSAGVIVEARRLGGR
jgi:DNA-binding beta-propeller fold protein YncE